MNDQIKSSAMEYKRLTIEIARLREQRAPHKELLVKACEAAKVRKLEVDGLVIKHRARVEQRFSFAKAKLMNGEKAWDAFVRAHDLSQCITIGVSDEIEVEDKREIRVESEIEELVANTKEKSDVAG